MAMLLPQLKNAEILMQIFKMSKTLYNFNKISLMITDQCMCFYMLLKSRLLLIPENALQCEDFGLSCRSRSK